MIYHLSTTLEPIDHSVCFNFLDQKLTFDKTLVDSSVLIVCATTLECLFREIKCSQPLQENKENISLIRDGLRFTAKIRGRKTNEFSLYFLICVFWVCDLANFSQDMAANCLTFDIPTPRNRCLAIEMICQ